jgi:quinol monooxygenase YgiN
MIAKIPIKEEKRDQAIEAFKQFIDEVAKEEGTLSYTLNVSKNDPNTLVIIERYKDQDAFNTHSTSPHMKAFSTKARDLFAGKMEAMLMDELAAK